MLLYSTELSVFLQEHIVKVAAIQESNLMANMRSPNIQNYTLVQHEWHLGPAGGLLFYIHNTRQFHSQATVNVEE